MLAARFVGTVLIGALIGVGGPAPLFAQPVPVRLPPLEDEATWETSNSFSVPLSQVATGPALPAIEELPPPDSVVPRVVVPTPPPEPGLPGSTIAPTPDQLPASVMGPSANPSQPVVQGPWTTGTVGGGGGLGGMMGGVLIGGSVHGSWFAPERVFGQSARLGYEEEQINLRAPIVQGKYGILFANARIVSEQISTSAILPDSRRAFPDQLWNVGVGLGGLHRFANGWTAMADVSLGSASDRPFSANTTTIGLMTSLRVPRGPRNAWLFSLMYANNSPLPIPIPGVAYAYSPSPRLFMMIGLPPSIVYRPTDNIVLEARYMPLYNAHVRATYILSPMWRFYGGFDWENQTYFLSDRPVQTDRFYYFDERLSAGAQHLLGKHWVVDLSSGYLFNRYFFQATSFTGTQTDRVNIGAGPYAALFLNARY